MQAMRDLLRSSLARSLRTLDDGDRLATALPLVCGSVLAGHCEVVSHASDGRVVLQVDEVCWLEPLLSMRGVLQHDLARISGVAIREVHFQVARPAAALPWHRPRGTGKPGKF